MATLKKLSDLFSFNPITNPGGGFNIANTTPATLTPNGATPNSLFGGPIPSAYAPTSMTAAPAFGPTTPMAKSLSTTYAPAPVVPPPVAPVARATPIAARPATSLPTIQQTPTPAPTPAGSDIPAQWRRADGSIKTPEEIAAEVGSSLKSAHSGGDIGRLAYALNNTRNDIAVGETDPYKVASQSGIPYTAAELKAIEKSYAGIYDPALDSAFAKVKDKQAADKAAADAKAEEDKIRLQAQLDSEKPYTLGTNDVRYDGKGNVIARGNPSAATTGASSGSTGYVKGANPVVDGWVESLLRSGKDVKDVIPGVANQALRNQVMLGLNARRFDSAATAGTLDDINTLNLMLQNPDLGHISGFFGQALGGIFGQAKDAKTKFNQIAGALQLAKAGNIKGQGAVSDYERTVLKDASVVANRGQSDQDFRNALIKIRGAMMTASGLEAPVRITDPETGQSEVQSLNSMEIADFIKDGAIIVYVEN